MERLSIEREHEELAKIIASLQELLGDSKKIDALISSELENAKIEFPEGRRTEIVDSGSEINYEDMIEDDATVPRS